MQSKIPPRLRGCYAPVLTPFNSDRTVNVDAYISHCRWLISQGCDLAIFGTNSEACSVSVEERIALTEALLEAGVAPEHLLPGTGMCALPEAVQLSRHAVENGARGVLVLPPFFFKNPSQDGLFGYFSDLIEHVGDERLVLYLYHIPQMTQVPITVSLIERLMARYPQAIGGVKDSSGDWDNTRSYLDAFAQSESGFSVFPASESAMRKAMDLGGAGCISGTANVNPGRIRKLFEAQDAAQVQALQPQIDRVRSLFQSVPMIPAMKALIARELNDSNWRNVRPPLTTLDVTVERDVLAQLDALGFQLGRV